MNLELMQLMATREYYDKYHTFINTRSLSKEEHMLFFDMGVWFSTGPGKNKPTVDWGLFRSWFFNTSHPSLKEDIVKIMSAVIDRVVALPTLDTDFAEDLVTGFMAREKLGEIADIAMRGYEGSIAPDFDKIESIIEQYKDKSAAAVKLDSFFVEFDLDKIAFDLTVGGYDWRLHALNESIGQCRKGKLIIVGARPGIGKTSFILSEATFIAPQMEADESVILFNNEEGGDELVARAMETALNKSWEEIEVNLTKATTLYEKALGGDTGRLKVFDKAGLSVSDVERTLKSHKAGLIMINQLWKVKGFYKASSETERQAKLFQWARELAKKYAPVIGVVQLGIEANGKEWPTDADIYLSKTAVQGEADAILLIGCSHKVARKHERYLGVVKVKQAYGPEVDPDMSDGRYTLKFDKLRGRYEAM